MSALIVVTPDVWVVCPICRVFAGKQRVEDLHGETPTKCPWCEKPSTMAAWLEAGARDLCECGCPRAAHIAYGTSDRLAPGSTEGQHIVAYAAPCFACGCQQVSGAQEVRLT